jgi:hypothetical protein
MIFIVGHYDLEYLPPSYEKLRITVLKEVKNDLIKNLNVVKESWKEIGCTITCDGWTSVDNILLLNILCVCSKGDFVCKELIQLTRQKWQLIEKMGSENVVQVVTHNAAVCKSVGRIIENKYPHITYNGYTTHGIDLVLEDIGKID